MSEEGHREWLEGYNHAKAENAQLRQDLRDAVEIIRRVGDKIGGDCPICTGGINQWGHVQACYDLQNWADRPSIKAVMEGKG